MSHGKMTLYKLVVLGDGGVGKTALTIQLCLNHFVETYDPTIEDSYRKQVVIDQQSCMLEVLDTAGQEEYTALRDQWIRDGEGFVLVYSISSRASFARIEKFHHQIQRTMNASFGPAPVMLVGNKCDRVTEREVSTQEGSALAKQLNCEFVEASAKNCINVETAFFNVVRQLRKQRANAPPARDSKGYNSGANKGQRPAKDAYYDNDRKEENRYRRPRKNRSERGGGSKCVVL